MALTENPIPDAATQAFLNALGGNDSLREFKFSLPIYALSLPQLVKAGDPVRPTLIGWQLLTGDLNGLIAGEVANNLDQPSVQITSSLTRGMIVDEAWKAYAAIKANPAVINEPAEIRRLRISPLRIDAFWLKASAASDALDAGDRLYPFISFDDRLKDKLLPAADFITIVRELAAKATAQKSQRTPIARNETKKR